MALTGVEEAKAMRYFLHFGRGREIARRAVVSAKEVGAIVDVSNSNEKEKRTNLCV